MYYSFSVKGKKYRIKKERLQEAGIILCLIAETVCFIGWCYWGWF